MTTRHALRLTAKRRADLRKLAAAGDEGLPLVLLTRVTSVLEFGLAETYCDTNRILSQRVRLTDYGRRVVRDLIETKEPTCPTPPVCAEQLQQA